MTASETNERDIDAIIQQVQQQMPEVEVTRLRKVWPADDNNLWWFALPGFKQDVHVEGSACPFLIETNEQCCEEALKAETVGETVMLIVSYLQSIKEGGPVRLTGQLFWV